ncbi:MAG: hypothetical protein ACO259_09800, partial [Bacteroidia bacterium]
FSLLFVGYAVHEWRRHYKFPFSFTQFFPYELFAFQSPKQTVYAHFIMTIIGVGWLSFYWYIFPLSGTTWTVPMLMGVLLNWIIFYMMLMDLKHPIERFVFLSSLSHMFAIVLPILIILFSLTTPFERFAGFLPWAAGTLASIQCLLLFIPRLIHWTHLEAKKTGEIVEYVRPRFFILAIFQWSYLLSFYLLNLSILIAYLA